MYVIIFFFIIMITTSLVFLEFEFYSIFHQADTECYIHKNLLNYAYLMEDQTETKTQKRDTSEPYGFAITIPKKKN